MGIRLYFKHFSTNYYNSEQRAHRMLGIKLKNNLKATVLAQLSGAYAKIPPDSRPVIIDFTFFSTHKYDVDNYSAMVKYIQDCLVFRGILQDDNQKIIGECRIRVKPITNETHEGCLIRFLPNSEILFPDDEIKV